MRLKILIITTNYVNYDWAATGGERTGSKEGAKVNQGEPGPYNARS